MNESLTVTGRRGDSASFTIEFEQDMSRYNVVFQVKKNSNDSDSAAIVRKEVKNPVGKSVTFNLTSDDTLKFKSSNDGYGQYIWGVKVYNGIDFAQTLIPMGNRPAPIFMVFPSIVEGCTNG